MCNDINEVYEWVADNYVLGETYKALITMLCRTRNEQAVPIYPSQIRSKIRSGVFVLGEKMIVHPLRFTLERDESTNINIVDTTTGFVLDVSMNSVFAYIDCDYLIEMIDYDIHDKDLFNEEERVYLSHCISIMQMLRERDSVIKRRNAFEEMYQTRRSYE